MCELDGDDFTLSIDVIMLPEFDTASRRYSFKHPGSLSEYHGADISLERQSVYSKGEDARKEVLFNTSDAPALYEDVINMMKNESIYIPYGLDRKQATYVLLQRGAFHQFTPLRTFLPTDSTAFEELRSKIEIISLATRYLILLVMSNNQQLPDDEREQLESEIKRFLQESIRSELNGTRSLQSHQEQNDIYPLLSRYTVFQTLAKENWCPPILKEEEPAPTAPFISDGTQLDEYITQLIVNASLLHIWENRRLAKTADGFVCCVHRETEVGDRLAFIAPSTKPLILRKRDDGRYKLIGHAEALGLMYGEVAELGYEPQRIVLS
jgi:hypothetical protein